jgi:CubicO group peptidase (beta-lactamase class C family)
MKNINLFILFTTFLGTFAQNQIPPAMQQEIDSLIEEMMISQNIPGFGLAITKNNGEIHYTRGYGYADLESRNTADAETLFGIGSITKVIS